MVPHREKALTNLDFLPTSNLRPSQRLGYSLGVPTYTTQSCMYTNSETNHQIYTKSTKPRRLRSHNEVIDKAEFLSKPFKRKRSRR